MRRCYFLLVVLTLGVMWRVAVAAPDQSTQTTEAPKTPRPTECMADPKSAAVSAEYGGKTYYFKNQACKDEFLTDPERYSQLYDALLELKAQGKPLQKPKPLDNASAVPS